MLDIHLYVLDIFLYYILHFMDFNKLWEKKKQIEQSLKIWKAIENLVIHSKNDFYECYIDYQFRIFDLKLLTSEENFCCNSESLRCELILDCINKAIQKMQLEIMQRTKEVLNTRPRWR